jgi:hypothetical protein
VDRLAGGWGVVGVQRRGLDGLGAGRGAVGGRAGVRGEPLEVQRGAAEQQLEVKLRRAAAA